MGSKSGGGKSINCWRNYFRTTNSDIFDIIEHAIIIAAKDYPNDFRVRRGRIVEVLFSCSLAKCLDHYDGVDEGGYGGGGGIEKSRVNSISGDDDDDGEEEEDGGEMMEMNGNGNVCQSSLSYGDAEALTEEIEQEQEIIGEVHRIKEILLNFLDESDSVLFESLRRLQLMALTVDILKTTEIGKAVNGIRRHSSKQIRHLARSLIDGWKVIVDEWVKATQEISEGGTPDSVNPSVIDEEEGLPSPPLDEGAFFATQTMELSQFFDGMDDDGNPRNCREFNKNREVVWKPAMNVEAPKQREPPPKHANSCSNYTNLHKVRRQEPPIEPNRPSNMQSGPGRPSKIHGEMKVVKDPKIQQKPAEPVNQRRPVSQPEKLRSSTEDAVQEKLEATKRKLQERYQQAENAKRQRTIQVMELHDLPKQGVVNKNTQGKFGNYNRHWANGRK